MKTFVLWLIKVFKLDIPTVNTIEKIVEKEVYLPTNGIIDGDITIKGNVLIKGSLKIDGSLTIKVEE